MSCNTPKKSTQHLPKEGKNKLQCFGYPPLIFPGGGLKFSHGPSRIPVRTLREPSIRLKLHTLNLSQQGQTSPKLLKPHKNVATRKVERAVKNSAKVPLFWNDEKKRDPKNQRLEVGDLQFFNYQGSSWVTNWITWNFFTILKIAAKCLVPKLVKQNL